MIPELAQNEIKIDTWAIQYISPYGRKFNGKLTVTNKRLMYNAEGMESGEETFAETASPNGENEGCLQIHKKDISEVQVERNFMAKKAIVVLANGSRHTFNYGALNIDRVVEAIRTSV